MQRAVNHRELRTAELLQRAEAICLRAGQGSKDGEPLVLPIVQSTTYCRDGLQSQAVHKYSRESNPTVSALEEALGALEGVSPGVAFSTGLAAETALFMTLLSAGDHVVCSAALYGGTTRLLEQVLNRMGIETTFVDSRSTQAVEEAFRANTRLVFLETPANPTLDLVDLAAISELAHSRDALVAVDNTFMTPVLQRPLDHGADFTVSSTTKFLEGHSVALGGAVVGRDEEWLEKMRFVRKCTGAIQTPFNAWLTIQGLKTLPLRLRAQAANAQVIAEALEQSEHTSLVNYPGLASFPQAELAQAQHEGGHGAVISFELVGGAARARALLNEVRHCRLVEHVGGLETLLTHSASMTHGGVSPEQRKKTGVSEALLRISVGIESSALVLEDLNRALEATKNVVNAEEVTPCSGIA